MPANSNRYSSLHHPHQPSLSLPVSSSGPTPTAALAARDIRLPFSLLQHNAVHARLHQRIHAGDFALEEAQSFGDLDGDGTGGEGGDGG